MSLERASGLPPCQALRGDGNLGDAPGIVWAACAADLLAVNAAFRRSSSQARPYFSATTFAFSVNG